MMNQALLVVVMQQALRRMPPLPQLVTLLQPPLLPPLPRCWPVVRRPLELPLPPLVPMTGSQRSSG